MWRAEKKDNMSLYSWGLAYHRLLTRSPAQLEWEPPILRRIRPDPSSENTVYSSKSHSNPFIVRNKSTVTSLNTLPI